MKTIVANTIQFDICETIYFLVE